MSEDHNEDIELTNHTFNDLEALVLITIEENGDIVLVTTKTPTEDQASILRKIILLVDEPSLFLKAAMLLETFVNWLDYITKKGFVKLVKMIKKEED